MNCHMFRYMALKFHPALSRAINWSFCDKFLNDRDPLIFFLHYFQLKRIEGILSDIFFSSTGAKNNGSKAG